MSLRVTMADAIGLRRVVSNTSRVRRAPGRGHPGLASARVVAGGPIQSEVGAVCSLEGEVLRRSCARLAHGAREIRAQIALTNVN
jgi:hypothetical protein